MVATLANRPRTSKSKIDNLPEIQRQRVFNALMDGKGLREIGRLAGVSAMAVARYKSNVFRPALKQAQQIQALKGFTGDIPTDTKAVATVTRDIVRSSPFRDQLASLKDRTERLLDRAESGIRARDDGKPNTADAAACAPLIAQAHKNVELLGRATGELEQAAGPQIAVQIVIPASQGVPDASAPAVDVSCSLRGTGRE